MPCVSHTCSSSSSSSFSIAVHKKARAVIIGEHYVLTLETHTRTVVNIYKVQLINQDVVNSVHSIQTDDLMR